MSSTETSPLLPSIRAEAANEDAASTSPQHRRSARGRDLTLFAWALLATAAVVITAVWTQHSHTTNPPPTKRNLIFMVSDGMGPASLSLTRSFRQHVEGLPIDNTLTLDRHFWGTSRTRSSNSLVTDSAAGATAFSCGKKSYNGAISVLPDHSPCGTVLEAAKRAGYTTGLVVTTDITDATPACFASHVLTRAEMDEIAIQEVGLGPMGRNVDLMLGGGRCHFLPGSANGGCRADDIDVVAKATSELGWHYAGDRAAFDALKHGNNVTLPVLGLFADRDIPFELDRRNEADVYPSLSEMAVTALRALEKATAKSDKGFFLMIEGSRIDHAGHINDPAAQVHEVLEYDKAFKGVLEFLQQSNDEGILIATSDHETGGLATAIQEPGHLPVYNWYPAALAAVNTSCERLASQLQQHVASGASKTRADLKQWITETLIVGGLGITDVKPTEVNELIDNPDVAINTFAAIISLRAHIGWSTHGHTAVDVNIYSSGSRVAWPLRGNVENTDVGKFLREYLSVDVDAVTKDLRKKFGTLSVSDNVAEKASQAVLDAMKRWVPGM